MSSCCDSGCEDNGSPPPSANYDDDGYKHTELLDTRRAPNAVKLVQAVRDAVGPDGRFKVEVRVPSSSPSLPSMDRPHLLEGKNADMTMQMLHNVYNISSDTKLDLVRLVL